MKWFLKVLGQYADFSGRARRTEYWMFALFAIILYILAIILDNALGIAFAEIYGPIYFLTIVFLFIPSLAVLVRRLHDVGKSGFWFFIAFIPFGAIWLFILTITDSQPFENKWGPNPKGIDTFGGGDNSVIDGDIIK